VAVQCEECTCTPSPTPDAKPSVSLSAVMSPDTLSPVSSSSSCSTCSSVHGGKKGLTLNLLKNRPLQMTRGGVPMVKREVIHEEDEEYEESDDDDDDVEEPSAAVISV
jgi:hypothetical protein